jgi:hypothetical protein
MMMVYFPCKRGACERKLFSRKWYATNFLVKTMVMVAVVVVVAATATTVIPC